VPCGISDADVTSLTLETGRRVTIDEATPLLVAALHEHLGPLLAASRLTAAPGTA